MRAPSSPAKPVTVLDIVRRLAANPWGILIATWNWKAGLLSGLFRAAFFGAAVLGGGPAALRGVAIQLAFRIAVGGLWGSLAQAFRAAQPAWLAGLLVAVILPAGVHTLEYESLRAGHASHIRTGMIVSVSLSIVSLLLNWGLMRKGLLLTGKGTASLAADLKRLPAALGELALAVPRALARVLGGSFA